MNISKNQKLINDFIHKHCEKQVFVKFDMEDKIIPQQFDAFVPSDKIILISKKIVMSTFDISIKALLLHEIGHIYTYRKRGRIKSEYDAHKWALDYTKKNHMYLEYNSILKDAQSWVCNFGWNTNKNKRTYIIVGKIILNEYKPMMRR